MRSQWMKGQTTRIPSVEQYEREVYATHLAEIKLKLRKLILNQTMRKESTKEEIEQINTATTKARQYAKGNEEKA